MIGPAKPPGLQQSNAAASDDDSDDGYGPTLPPGFQRPTAGPSLPPVSAATSTSQAGHTRADDSDSSDEDVGPLPAGPSAPQAQAEDGVAAFLERERLQRERDANSKEGKLQRADWMMKPPTESELLSSMDPTKLRSRGFNTAADANRKKAATKDQSLWTESPAERAQRLADEASGKKKRLENAEDNLSPEEREALQKKRKRDKTIAKELEGYNATRSESLMDNHTKKQKTKGPDEDDGKPPAIWDRDSMLGSASRMDSKKKQEIINSAKGPSGLSSRFGSGGFS